MSDRDELAAYYEWLIKDQDFGARRDDMAADTKKARNQWKDQKDHKLREGFPSDFLKQYERSGDALESKKERFDAMLIAGSAPRSQLISAFEDYWYGLRLLQTGNERAEALLKIYETIEKANYTRSCMELAKLGKSQILSSLEDQLKTLKKKLEAAQDEAIMLPIKHLLKLLAGVVIGAVGAAVALPAAATAVGVVTASVAIDYVSGKKASEAAMANADKAAKQIIKLNEKRLELAKEAGDKGKEFEKQALKKFEKAAKGAGAAKLGVDMYVVKEKLKHLREMIASTQDAFNRFSSDANPIAKELASLQKTLDGNERESS